MIRILLACSLIFGLSACSGGLTWSDANPMNWIGDDETEQEVEQDATDADANPDDTQDDSSAAEET